MEKACKILFIFVTLVALETVCAWHRYTVKNVCATVTAVEVCVWPGRACVTLLPPSCGRQVDGCFCRIRFLSLNRHVC